MFSLESFLDGAVSTLVMELMLQCNTIRRILNFICDIFSELAVSVLVGKVGKYKLLDIVRYTECFKHTHSRMEDWTRYDENGIFCIMYDTVMYCKVLLCIIKYFKHCDCELKQITLNSVSSKQFK